MTKQTVYFITGGNRGIGFNLVKELSERENNVVITTARKPEDATELNKLIKSNSNVHVVKLDVSSKQSNLDAAGEVAKIAEGIDVFISNAAIADSYKTVLETDEELWTSHWKTNVLGSIFSYQAFYPLLAKGNDKQIIFISSLVGSIGGFFDASVSAYGQSKAALNYTTKEISFELREQGFTVVAVHPGMVSTDMGNHGKSRILKSAPHLKDAIEGLVINPETSASSLLSVIDKLSTDDNGKFISYDGSELPW
ncbi:DEHA2C04598p [Debaryomyces hansenii CBS767]|uniref:DEHA2C04598p n=1 Tax=Debaryomyces hansenii (strain ATCC 36239 / CBS 767 / BCRC 21394 / JCM 1990 / NBRC 0083 / IGC 2968) TaxID=284592 RepID=Q6BV83_DEBHA|nr:DEHA2C04598p [Debaryomyces hansenii CBS767]CAG85936.2 DEHA2C04598p [Debaryomyces hansenii CBS767]|eukprot:XP_457886.2 DEHA2C04598p [Debaryomyces hansenii CBS767]